MKRSIKNIIMIVLIVLISSSMIVTMNIAKNDNASNLNIVQNNNQGTPPEKSDDENNKPPELPNEEQGELKENSNSDSDEKRPEMPSNEMGESQEPPSKPENGEDNFKAEMQGQIETKGSDLSTTYYVIFGIESLILSLLIIYLLMSNFNKKTIKETFTTGDKILIIVLLTIILTFGLTFLDAYITKNIFLNNNSTNEQKNQSESITYKGTKEITSSTTITDGEYESTTKDENALLISGDITANISNITVTKTGVSDSGDNSNFYGNNSALIAKSGANVTLDNITVKTEASGANGVFSYGGQATTNNSKSDGTTITIRNSKITTTGDNAGGIMTTGGGITKASNLTISTSGTSSAAIRTDRGGGTVTVDKGTYTTSGKGSPTIYSTADVTVSNATLTATASEGIVIEGKNSVKIENCNLTDSNTTLNGQSTTYKNIFLYQSMSGDAAEGNATFTAIKSNITTNNGDTFYITNTTATINLENNTITNNDASGNFLRAQKDSWGTTGSNGGKVTLIMSNQEAIGNIVIDSVSTINMTMKEKSYYEGTINGDNTAKSIELTIDKTSKIKLTGDSFVSSLTDEDTSYSNIDFNGYKLYVNGTAIN